MSRLGKLPIKILPGVTVSISDKEMSFKGPKGELKLPHNKIIGVKVEDDQVIVKPYDMDAKNASAMWGLMWSLIRNCVIGVGEGFVKKLEVNGVGYRAALSGSKLTLNLGYSNPVIFELPEGIKASVEGNIIAIEGADKAMVGETSARIRKLRKPEPYKGKGIKYTDEIIMRKSGKSAAK
ncbi:MAG: 50S ribosomal protein L6 [Patescibacteria group bacterium]|jgi:large subunit ribosomal protein L6|nr:50S ribosomal protein L6 [Patescibacteria group bacterium]